MLREKEEQATNNNNVWMVFLLIPINVYNHDKYLPFKWMPFTKWYTKKRNKLLVFEISEQEIRVPQTSLYMLTACSWERFIHRVSWFYAIVSTTVKYLYSRSLSQYATWKLQHEFCPSEWISIKMQTKTLSYNPEALLQYRHIHTCPGFIKLNEQEQHHKNIAPTYSVNVFRIMDDLDKRWYTIKLIVITAQFANSITYFGTEIYHCI